MIGSRVAVVARSAVSRSVATPSFGGKMAVRSASTGTVKWFNVSKGYGFIVPDSGDQPDIFVHQTAVSSTGFRFLREGERVEFEVMETDRGVQASNVTGPDGAPLDRSRDDERY